MEPEARSEIASTRSETGREEANPDTARGSLARRLSLLGIAASGVSLLIATLSFLVFESGSSRDELARSAVLLAEVTAANAAPALYFEDPITAQEALEALAAVPNLEIACLYREDGSEFAHFLPQNVVRTRCPRAKVDATEFADATVRVHRPVSLSGDQGGSIFIRLRSNSVRERLSGYLAIGLGVLLTSILVSILLSTQLQRGITEPLNELIATSSEIAKGNLATRLSDDGDGEIRLLAQAFGEMSQALRGMVSRVIESAQSVREGSDSLESAIHQMSVATESESDGVRQVHRSANSTAASAQTLNERAEHLSGTAERTTEEIRRMDLSISHVAERMDSLAQTVTDTMSSVGELSSSIDSIGSSTEQLRTTTGSTIRSLEDIGNSSKTSLALTSQAHGISEEMLEVSRNGRDSVDQTIEAIDGIRSSFVEIQEIVGKLAENSIAIQEIVTVIRSFSDGSRLLALNAQIIAAQAGEHGKSFAVVAHEVDQLAERAGNSVREIEALVDRTHQATQDVVDAVSQGASRVELGVSRSRDAGSALQAIQDRVGESGTLVKSIANGSDAEARQVEEAIVEVASLAQCVEEITRAMNEQLRASKWLAGSSEEVRQLCEEVKNATLEQRSGSSEIMQAVQSMNETTTLTVEATRQQIADAAQIENAMGAVRAKSDATQEATSEIERIMSILSERANDLEQLIAHFRL